jgi:hypothetical protein
MERFYTNDDTSEGAAPISNVSLHYTRIVQNNVARLPIGFSREFCALVCAYVKSEKGQDCGWYAFAGGRKDNSYSLDDHYCGFRRGLSPTKTVVRYLTYQEKGGMAHGEGLELGFISAEYVPNAVDWLNTTRKMMDPEDVFRRVDWGEFGTK